MFKIGEKVVYPGHGVAVIEEFTEKTVGSTAITFVKLSFVFKDMTILIPQGTIVNSGIRRLRTPEEIEMILEELVRPLERKFESIDFTPSGWNRRNKDYQAKIQSGRIEEIIKIYRDLMHISRQKELSFGEKTLLSTVEDLVIQEATLSLGQDRDHVAQLLRAPFRSLFGMDAPVQLDNVA